MEYVDGEGIEISIGFDQNVFVVIFGLDNEVLPLVI